MPLLLLLGLLPFLLSLGVAAQAAAVYAAGILPALYFWSKNQMRWRHREALRSLGSLLICAWLVFPFSNIVNAVLPLGETASALPWPVEFEMKRLFESRFSSAFLISGLVALGAAGLARGRRGWRLPTPSARRCLWWFAMGLALATCSLSAYLFLQTTTGLELRSATGVLAPEHRSLGGGLYRVFGFYGHPLSVAGVGLMWFSLAWMWLWGWLGEKSYGNETFLKGYCEPALPHSDLLFPLALLVTALLQFGFIILSGGRTALLVAGMIFVVVPLLVPLRGALRWMRRLLLLTAVPAVGVGLWKLGIVARFDVLVKKLESGMVADDRLLFWKTHLTIFQEKPWLGQGNYWLEALVRKEYYLRLGFQRLAEKKNFNAHNLYLEILADVGAVGTAVLLFLGLVFWRRLWARSRHLPVSRALFWSLAIAFLANLLHGLTENTFFVSNIALPYLAVMWVFLWVSVAEERSGR